MPPRPSAGVLLYRRTPGVVPGIEVLAGHMGGPFWARRDERAWSIPKGEFAAGEEPLAVALREFEEELGTPAPDLSYAELGRFRYSSGKTVTVFAAEAPAFEVAELRSNTFALEWPPRSGRIREFPELDRVAWLPLADARRLLVAGQVPALEALERAIAGSR